MWNYEYLFIMLIFYPCYACQVKFLQYLNALFHDDYVASLDNLHLIFTATLITGQSHCPYYMMGCPYYLLCEMHF